MEKRDIEFIRGHREIPDSMTDEDINEVENDLGRLPPYPDFMRVANLIELRNLRRQFYPSKPVPLVPRDGEDFFWLMCCEGLFLDGQYGPCCVWARATIEYELQELCLVSRDVSEETKRKIRRPGWNPGIFECLKALGDPLYSSCREVCEVIRDNGDHVVHHRIDKIADMKEFENTLREMGTKESAIKQIVYDGDGRLVQKFARFSNEIMMARESMRSLYEFESKRP